MSAQSSTGTCGLCGGTFGKVAMTRHLSKCSPSRRSGKSFHLVVEGRYAKAYWLHLAVPVGAHLSDVDDYLRGVWLECCGHLSTFEIDGEQYDSEPEDAPGEAGMHVAVRRVLEVGSKFFYEYDFGSTTALALKVVALREEGTPAGAIQLLARNDAPAVRCDQCKSGKPATQVCTECAWSEGGWLCEGCAAKHKCGSDMFLPVVNSPRVGVCGYTG